MTTAVSAWALTRAYSFSGSESVIGATITYKVKDGESLIEIARNFGLGYNEIVDANTALEPFVPGTGASVIVPSSWVIPEFPFDRGIIINLSELRLYYFFSRKGTKFVITFPIGIGREGFNTPVGSFRIMQKIINPSWHVPKSIGRENSSLPSVVPPGPDNPLGSHALRLSLGDVLIHGTNRPFGIGRMDSHGCIRLYPEDIPVLFEVVPKGAHVMIVRQPVKVGLRNKRVYIEVHKDESMKLGYIGNALELLSRKNLLKNVDSRKLYKAIEEKSGVPVVISK